MIGNPIAINKNPPTEKKKLDSWNAAKQRDKECALLWKNILFSAFPNIPGRAQRGKISPRAYIGARVSRIAALRNRMFHWDNLTALDIKMRYRDINEVLSAINPLLGTWLDSSYESEINQLIDDKPSWLKPYLSKKQEGNSSLKPPDLERSYTSDSVPSHLPLPSEKPNYSKEGNIRCCLGKQAKDR